MLHLKKLTSFLPLVAAAVVTTLSMSNANAQSLSGPSALMSSPGAVEVMADEAASLSRSLETRHLRARGFQEVNGSIILRGTPSPAQKFNRGKLIPCAPKDLGGNLLAASRYSCDPSKAIYVPISLPGADVHTLAPPGVYILGFENTIYPGFLYIQPARYTAIELQQIPVPAGEAVKVYRDLTSVHEQMKMYFTTYTLGQSFFSLGEWAFGDLYVKAAGVRDGAPAISYKYCEQEKPPAMTKKGERICRAWNQGSFMSLMEVFNFEPLSQTRNSVTSVVQSSIGGFTQYEVLFPGRPSIYRMGRMLVAKRTSATRAAFVNVLPGKYMVETTDAAGKATIAQTGAVGPIDASGKLLENFGWMPVATALKLEGRATSAAPPEVADGVNDSPEGDGGEYVNPLETCSSSKMWRTELRAYCKSDRTEGCNRQTAKMCEPTFDIP